jgi:hypothetical protein
MNFALLESAGFEVGIPSMGLKAPASDRFILHCKVFYQSSTGFADPGMG